MKKLLTIFSILFICPFLNAQKMEVVFCADFSGSTNGMVVELQKTIWATMNQLEAENSEVEIKCGLVGFGRKSFNKENYYSEVIHPLGTPINDIGYSLVKLQLIINSCDVYPQKAMNDCVQSIKWTSDSEVKKVIFFIGNGGIALKQMTHEVKRAKKKGITIKPIFFKPKPNYSNGLESWKSFAKNTGSELVFSEPNLSKVKFKKYYDESFIVSSGDKLLSTFLPYGIEGGRNVKQMERMIEKLKSTSSENYEEMLIYQSSNAVQGENLKWDLVDMAIAGVLDVNKLNKKDLPVFMQGFTNAQVEKYVSLKVRERGLVVSKLRLELSKRNEFVHRKQVKSQNFVGKGGLSLTITGLIQEEVSQL